jgi:hypothetical protein
VTEKIELVTGESCEVDPWGLIENAMNRAITRTPKMSMQHSERWVWFADHFGVAVGDARIILKALGYEPGERVRKVKP